VLLLGEQQERLIDALLTLASSERGIDQLEPFDLAALAGSVIAARAQLSGTRGIRIDATLRPASATGDPRLAESLVANLVDNALRYNEPGGWVSVETGIQPPGRSVLRVQNSGPVVPPACVESLLEPFRRLDGASRLNRGGLGLGLAIVAAIARAHDAALTVLAQPDGGLDIEVRF
jgi:signal transduction histidine kinase